MVFNATGSDRGSTAGDFKAAGCPLVRAGKMDLREANGLAMAGRCCRPRQDPENQGCCGPRHEGLMAMADVAAASANVERIADGCANPHWMQRDMGQWWRAKWKTGRDRGVGMELQKVILPDWPQA